jgi:hypothetical protein
MSVDKCLRCGRPTITAEELGAIPVVSRLDHMVTHCLAEHGLACRLAAHAASLAAALRSLARQPTDNAVRRTSLAVLESITGEVHTCPLCEVPGVVVGGVIKPHFAKAADPRPCRASYGKAIAGVLM